MIYARRFRPCLQRARCRGGHRAEPVVQRRPRARAGGAAQVGHVQLRRALDFHVRLHPDLHAGVVADRRRHELVAGRPHDFSRQPHRARPDGPQRPCRDALRHPLPGLLPRGVRHARRQRAGPAPRARGLRLVRHPDLDRRRGHLQDLAVFDCRAGIPRRRRTGSASPCRQFLCFLFFWGINMLVIYQRHRLHPLAAEHQGAAADRARLAAAVAGPIARRAGSGRCCRSRRQFDSGPAQGRAVLGLLLPGADRHGRLLGDAFAEHPRLLALRQIAARPGHRPGARPAADDGALLVHRRRRHLGDDHHLRPDDLGPGGRADAVQESRRAGRRHARALHRDAGDQHRRQRRQPRQRFRASRADEEFPSASADSSPASSAC